MSDKFKKERAQYLSDTLRMSGNDTYVIGNGFSDDVKTKNYIISITSKLTKKTIKVKYHQGLGIRRAPRIDDVMYALLRDAESFDSVKDIDEFAAEFCISKPSIAHKTYDACFESKQKLEDLGLDIERLNQFFQDF